MAFEYPEGECVMCGNTPIGIAKETNELLCRGCWNNNEEAKRSG